MQASKPHPQNSNPCTYFRLADGVLFGKRRRRKKIVKKKSTDGRDILKRDLLFCRRCIEEG
jgi:hypothetical protein